MPRVVVMTDDAKASILLDEHVVAEHLGSGHSAGQLIERLAWGVEDAVSAEAAVRLKEAGRVARR